MTPNVMTEGVYKKTAGGKGRRRGGEESPGKARVLREGEKRRRG